jgi:uncharacterized protein
MKAPQTRSTPWYREPWPWLLMSGPAMVVVAGIITAVLAARTHDGLVVDDYYKQGLAVNKDLSRDVAAKATGIYAEATIDASAKRVTLTLKHAPANIGELTLTLSRAAVSGHDRRVLLQRTVGNTFVGALMPLESGKWYVTLDDASRSWRLLTAITVQHGEPMTFSLGRAVAGAALKPTDD